MDEDEVTPNYTWLKDGIPKRGEKEFEPLGADDSLLTSSRNAMYTALASTRGHTLKNELNGIWVPSESRLVILTPKGNFFRDVGTSLNIKKFNGGLSLNSLETLFLVERGSLIVHLGDDAFSSYLYDDLPSFDLSLLQQLDLAYIYSLALEHTTLDELQVYSYLKRLGYLIRYSSVETTEKGKKHDYGAVSKIDQNQTRADKQLPENTFNASNSLAKFIKAYHYLRSTPFSNIFDFLNSNKDTNTTQTIVDKKGHSVRDNFFFPSIFNNLRRSVSQWLSMIGVTAYPITSNLHYFTKHYLNYPSIYKSLQLIPANVKDSSSQSSASLNKLTFDIWKPTPRFSKKNPPPPDFQIMIINTTKSKFPDLKTIKSIWSEVNYNPTPIARPKFAKKNTMAPSKRDVRLKRQQERQLKLDQLIQLKNKYLKLRDEKYKFGFRSFVIAIIDDGIMNFVNISEGDFTLKACNKLDELIPRDHGLVYMDN